MKRSFTPPSANNDHLVAAFKEVWTALFTRSTHLDSALSKLSDRTKPVVARIVPEMLRRPITYANVLGVGMLRGEPWSLDGAQLLDWRAGELLFRALIDDREAMDEVKAGGVDDFPPAMIAENADPALWEALTRSPPLTIRLKGSAEREEFGKKIHLHPTKWAPRGLTSPVFSRILGTEEYARGDFEIQDEGSQLMAVFALAPELVTPILRDRAGPLSERMPIVLPKFPPLNVIDTCAGAGGKTLAIADLLYGKGRVYAYDIYEGKLKALKKRAVRANTQNVKTLTLTPETDLAPFAGSADRVLIDAPCSGWGVLRRNPDLKWAWNPEKEADLPVLQRTLLDRFAPLVKKGGFLTYGVCTFRKSETTELIDAWLAEHPEWECPSRGFLGPGPTDGFYMAQLKKRD